MAVLGVGADHGEFRQLFAARTAEIEQRCVAPLDELESEVGRAEQAVAEARSRHAATADLAVGGVQARVRALSGPRGGPMTRSDVFRAGDVVNGYRLLEDFRVVGAGLSEWTFAERGGRDFFIKRFLSPTYPDDDAPGSERTKAKKRARCAAFEAHHRGIQAAMAPLTTYGGNLIATLDFFRDRREVLQGHREGRPGRACSRATSPPWTFPPSWCC